MNLRYWRKSVIKLLNLTNSVYNFSNNGSEAENSGIKTSTLAREHLSTQDRLAREYRSTQGTLAREHVNKQGTLAREHVSTQDTLAREHESSQGTLACEHVFSSQSTQFIRL